MQQNSRREQHSSIQPQSQCDEFVTFPAASILICELQRKRLRGKKKVEWPGMNALELLLAFNVLLGLIGLLLAFWP